LIRLMPALNISAAELDEGLRLLREALHQVLH
jgi:acetylornithine/N-succinyldiaminopimelate aminotransferase